MSTGGVERQLALEQHEKKISDLNIENEVQAQGKCHSGGDGDCHCNAVFVLLFCYSDKYT